MCVERREGREWECEKSNGKNIYEYEKWKEGRRESEGGERREGEEAESEKGRNFHLIQVYKTAYL